MKKLFRPATVFVSLLMMGCSLGFTSCSDDDDAVDMPTEITTKTMYGDYLGKMTFLAASATDGEESQGIEVNANVNNDTVCIKKFPIKDIVMSIVNDEGTADDIVAAVGDIDYKIGYKPVLTSAKDSIMMAMEPEPLTLHITLPTAEGEEVRSLTVTVKVEALEKAAYSVEDGKMEFDIKAIQVMLGEGDEQVELPDFNPLVFSFNLNQSKVNPLRW
ncbi:MAG: DUF4840 domain-containing protein [Prevotella sp.]